MSLQFEWDEEKARTNAAKHGVSFEFARTVFSDAFAIERIDEASAEEERFIFIGMAAGHIIYVVYTVRNGIIRLISARQATRREQDDYFRQNS